VGIYRTDCSVLHVPVLNTVTGFVLSVDYPREVTSVFVESEVGDVADVDFLRGGQFTQQEIGSLRPIIASVGGAARTVWISAIRRTAGGRSIGAVFVKSNPARILAGKEITADARHFDLFACRQVDDADLILKRSTLASELSGLGLR